MRNQSRQQLTFQALLAERAHFMRHNLAETESQLWRQLAGSALGVALLRQVPVDRYIVDFLAPSVGLVVEVDGGVHSAHGTRDAHRDRVLQRLGYRVLRVDTELVRANITEAVALVMAPPNGAMVASENVSHNSTPPTIRGSNARGLATHSRAPKYQPQKT